MIKFVRDAACYVCWAFARAYDPLVLQPHVASIANGLLIVSCFDREVNCRRAASAAFQENVGRQGTFPHGIDILTVADYFSVGSRTNSYLDISVFIAGFKEYSRSLIKHLMDKKIGHWDVAVRELTAKALHKLTPCDPDFVREIVLPHLLHSSLGRDLHLCHGSTLAVGEIVASLSKATPRLGVGLEDYLGPKTVLQIESLVEKMIENHKLRGLGGEIMRQSVSSFIQNISISGLGLHNKPAVATWLEVLEENLSCVELSVQAAAIDAVPAFLDQFWQINGILQEERRDKTLDNFIAKLNCSEVTRRGFSSALGALPARFVRGKEEEVIHALIKASRITEGTEKWAEARRDAVKALGGIVVTCVGWLNPELIPHVYDCFLLSLEDYTLDRRGDTGAWVREAAMAGVEAVSLALLASGPARIQASLISQIMPYLVQQANEKIARTRGQAGKVFRSLLWASSPSGESLPGIARMEELRTIFPKDLEITWTVESDTFPRFIQLLTMSEYLDRLILGLIVSTGGLTERLVKNSSESLFTQLRRMTEKQILAFTNSILTVFKNNQKVDRVTVPLFKFLEQLLLSGCLDKIVDDAENPFSFQLFNLCKNEISKCGDPNKIMTSGDVFCQLLQAGDNITVKKCLVQLSIFLCHKFPRVRKSTAEKLYEAILTFSVDREVIPGNKCLIRSRIQPQC